LRTDKKYREKLKYTKKIKLYTENNNNKNLSAKVA